MSQKRELGRSPGRNGRRPLELERLINEGNASLSVGLFHAHGLSTEEVQLGSTVPDGAYGFGHGEGLETTLCKGQWTCHA